MADTRAWPLVHGIPKLRSRLLRDGVAHVQVQAGSSLREAIDGRDSGRLSRIFEALGMTHDRERDHWLAVAPNDDPARWVVEQLRRQDGLWPAIAQHAVAAMLIHQGRDGQAPSVTLERLSEYERWLNMRQLGWEQRFFSVRGPFRRLDLLEGHLVSVPAEPATDDWTVYPSPPAELKTVDIIWRDFSRRLLISRYDGTLCVCDVVIGDPAGDELAAVTAAALRRGRFQVRRFRSTEDLAGWVAEQAQQHPVTAEQVRWHEAEAPTIPLAYGPLADRTDATVSALDLDTSACAATERVAWDTPRVVGADVDYSNARALRRRAQELTGREVSATDDDELRHLLLESAETKSRLFARLPAGSAAGWVLTDDVAGRPDEHGDVEALRSRTLPSGFAHAGVHANPNRLRGRLRHQRLAQPLNLFA